MPEEWEKWAARLRQYRELLFDGTRGGQGRFADSIGVPRPNYQRYEAGTAQPDVPTWVKISAALHVPIDTIMKGGQLNLTSGPDPASIREALEEALARAASAAIRQPQSAARPGNPSIPQAATPVIVPKVRKKSVPNKSLK